MSRMIGTTGRTMWGRIESLGRIDEDGDNGENGDNRENGSRRGTASWEVSDVAGR
jgi:hypothetical protein